MWLANRFPSVRRLLKENEDLKARLKPANATLYTDAEAAKERDEFFAGFARRLAARPPGRILEIGARNRTGRTILSLIPPGWSYDGLDLAPDTNVTAVGDAHEASHYFQRDTFDAVISCATFEHLLMPWKVAIEINKIARTGALVMIASHQTFPLHEVPADYFRFSAAAWDALFNRYTGFRVLESKMCRPVSIVPRMRAPSTDGLEDMPAFIHGLVVAEKIGDTDLRWDVPFAEVNTARYPDTP